VRKAERENAPPVAARGQVNEPEPEREEEEAVCTADGQVTEPKAVKTKTKAVRRLKSLHNLVARSFGRL
jgi:hypothetical protein